MLQLLFYMKAKLIPRLRAARNIAWAKRATDGPAITIGRLRFGGDREPVRALGRLGGRQCQDLCVLVTARGVTG